LKSPYENDRDLIVQGVNTGDDVGNNHFDVSMIGGGFGVNNGCANSVFAFDGSKWDG
jgi:Glycosyl hydrolase family 45